VHVMQMTNLNLLLSICKLSCTLKPYTPHQMSFSGKPSEIECNLPLAALLDCCLLRSQKAVPRSFNKLHVFRDTGGRDQYSDNRIRFCLL